MEEEPRVFRTPAYEGLVFGVELEIEAPGLYEPEEVFNSEDEKYETRDPVIPRGWLREQEDSIAGVELISAKPVTFETAVGDITRVFKDIEAQGFRPTRSPRGSTHVHVNISDLTLSQLTNFVMACAWSEPALIELAGKGRKGNLFAQSYEICPIGWAGIIKSIRDTELQLENDTHYMATSFFPISYLGSVEFRMGPSARTAEEAIEWLSYINLVAVCGREEEIDGETPPYCLRYLLNYVTPHKRDLVMNKARRQAREIWYEFTKELVLRPKVLRLKMPTVSIEVLGDVDANPAADIPSWAMTPEQMQKHWESFQAKLETAEAPKPAVPAVPPPAWYNWVDNNIVPVINNEPEF